MSERKEDIYVVVSGYLPLYAAKSKRLADRLAQIAKDCGGLTDDKALVTTKIKLFSPAKLKPQQLEGLRKAFHNETKS